MREHLAPGIDGQNPSFGPTPSEMSAHPPWALSASHDLAHQTRWVVIEPASDLLWTTVRRMTEGFLHRTLRNAGLLGAKPEDLYSSPIRPFHNDSERSRYWTIPMSGRGCLTAIG